MDVTRFEGASLPPRTVVLERGPVTNFAASLTDANPAHHRPDAAADAGLAAIPAAPTWPLAMEHWGAFPERQPDGADAPDPMWQLIDALMTGGGLILHGEEEFVYQRPILVGDVLHSTGVLQNIRSKETTSATMTFADVTTEWRDNDGHLVVTEIRTIIHRH